MEPLFMSEEERNNGRADILIDGELHHFEYINNGSYWIDTSTGEDYNITDFEIFY